MTQKISAVVFTKSASDAHRFTERNKYREYEKFAKKNNLEIIKVFDTSGVSGVNCGYDGEAMLQFITKNQIDCIICQKLDRCLRSQALIIQLEYWLQQNPRRKIYFLKERQWYYAGCENLPIFWNWRLYLTLSASHFNGVTNKLLKYSKI